MSSPNSTRLLCGLVFLLVAYAFYMGRIIMPCSFIFFGGGALLCAFGGRVHYFLGEWALVGLQVWGLAGVLT